MIPEGLKRGYFVHIRAEESAVMVELETVDELAEHIADLVGVYGCLPDDTGFSDHPESCNCRICFVSAITERIRQAVKNEIFLSNMKELEKL